MAVVPTYSSLYRDDRHWYPDDLVENVIGRRLRVIPLMPLATKSKIKEKHLQILEDSWLHGASWHLVSWLITWY